MQINLTYTNDISPELHSKLEKGRKYLCEVLESWEFKEKASVFEDTPDFLRFINGFTANVLVRDLSQINRPFAYNKETKTVSVDPKRAIEKDVEDIAGYLAHEIGHQWYDHEGGSYGGFMGFLQYEIPNMTPDPSIKEKLACWGEWATVKIGHLLVAVLGFPFLPLAFLLKYQFGIKNLWLLNDTEDGDYGTEAFIRALNKKKVPTLLGLIKIKRGWYSAMWWYFRNSVWNLKNLTAPDYTGEYDIVQIVKHEIRNPMSWANQYDRGTNYVYFEVEGKLYFHKTGTNDIINYHFGMISRKVNARYNFKLRRSK